MFCLHCGKEVPEAATFCLACGKPLRRETTTQKPSRGRSVRVLLGIVLLLFVVYIFFSRTRTSPLGSDSASAVRPFSLKLYSGDFTVSPAQYRYQTFSVGNTF